ncbi:MAG: hypothetical protein IT308_12670 [Anaerolineaceae bacterium]|nr:hypothetical protein [Anaerolineaceae bacterium]
MLTTRSRLSRLTTLAILLMLVFSLSLPTRALAEGETPEPPAEPQGEVLPTEEAPAETPEGSPSEVPAESPTPEGTETAPVSTASPTTVAPQTSSDPNPADEENPINALLATTAEAGLGITIVNSAGENVPLGSQEAADILLADPQFCWEDINTHVLTCGASHATFDDALTDAYAHNFAPNQKGIIIFEAGTFAGGQTIAPANWGLNTAPLAFELRGAGQSSTILTSGLTFSNFTNAAFYLNNMTIQGGLGFDSNNNTVVNLEDLTLNHPSGTGLTISNQTGSGGAVQLTRVTSSGNGDDGADIQVQGSGATVLISDSQFSNNGNYGFYVAANNLVTLSNVVALNNARHSLVDNDYGGNKDIYVINSQFSSTTQDGLRLFAGGSAVVNRSYFNSSLAGSGLSAWANVNTAVFCSQANNNGVYGFDVGGGGSVYLYGINAFGNGSAPYTISGGWVDYRADYCCSGNCPPPDAEPVPAPIQRLGDIIIPVYIGTEGNTGTLVNGRNLIFQLLSKNNGSEDLLAEVKVPGYSTFSGTTFGMKPLLTNSPLPVPAGNEMVGSPFLMDVFGLVRSTLNYLDGNMEFKFYLPEGFVVPPGMTVTVQFFDEESNSWRVVPSTRYGNVVYAYNDLIGPYALVLVPVQ